MRIPFHTLILVAALGGVGPLGMVTTPPAYAQEAPAASRVDTRQQSVSQIVARMSRTAGVTIVADSTVGNVSTATPGEDTTPQNFENQIADLVKGLPKGTTWAKIYLPDPKGRRAYSGDDIAAFAVAQSRLFGPVGASNEVEIMGQKIPADQADAYVKGLNLQAYYVITNPQARGGQTGMFAGVDAQQWGNMSQEDRQRSVQAAASQLASMDPASRSNLMQQHFMVMSAMMRMLPPDQRGFSTTFVGPNGEQGVVRIIDRQSPAHP